LDRGGDFSECDAILNGWVVPGSGDHKVRRGASRAHNDAVRWQAHCLKHDALEFARSGDTLIVWKLDRLARPMKQSIETVEQLRGGCPEPC
jgi:hypothetical protein